MSSVGDGCRPCDSCCCCCGAGRELTTVSCHNNNEASRRQTTATTTAAVRSRRRSRFWKWIKRRLLSVAHGEDVAYRRRTEALEDVSLTLTKRLSFINEDKRGSSTVELVKREGSTLGLILSGGIDKGSRPKVESLRPGSIAHRCDALAVGDHIVAVNGIRTSKLKHDEIVNLLKNAGDKVVLDVEYEIPSTAAEMSMCVCPKVIQVKLEKENSSFGFLIRGGNCPEKLKCRPLTITHVRPGGPADREGTIKAGDRLLAVDNINLNNASLNEAMAVLKQVEKQALLTIEYDVSVMDAVRNASGPLLVEIDKTPGAQLGATLTQVPHGEGAIVFDSIKQASVAERCGALHVGDQLLAIDGTRVDQMTAAEAMQLLKMAVGDVIRLEILPISQMALRKCPSTQSKRSGAPPPPPHGYASSYDTLSSMGGHSNRSAATAAAGRCPLPPLPPPQVPSTPSSSRRGKPSRKHLPEYLSSSSNASISSVYGVPPGLVGPSQLSHTETTQVVIYADHKGFGFALQGPTPYSADPLPPVPTISSIDPRGPAERTGVVQVGDRVLSVNGQTTEGLSLEEVTQLIQQSRPRVVLDIEFDVAESVIPSSGTFTVKLAKKGPGLGITITSPKNRRPGEPLLISDIKHGSVAHRTGTLQPGDHLLAIDSVRMDNCTIEDAAQILQASEEVVKLRIRKDEAFCEEPDATGAVIFTVELARHGGPLGITISGTEEPFDPIIISGLTEGGLAERTGALHVGDRILAINGQSLRGKPLSEAILLLQNSGDVVTLKISKSPRNQGLDAHRIERPKEVSSALRRSLVATPTPCAKEPHPPTFQPEPSGFLNLYATPIPSVDSAVESWDSYGGLEAAAAAAAMANGPAPIQNKVLPPPTPDLSRREADAPTSAAQPSSPQQSCPNVSAELKSWEREVWGHRPPPNLTAPGPSTANPQAFITTSNHSAASDSGSADWSKVLEDLETCGQSKLLRQIERSIMGSLPSIAPLPHPDMHLPNPENLQYDDLYGFQSRLQSDDTSTECEFQAADHEQAPFTLSPYEVQHDGQRHDGSVTPYPNYGGRMTAPIPIEVHRVTLFKDKVYEDFGFSVSDGLYEKGVYVNRIRPGGPADMSGILKPFDRILQVNETKTHDYDCCLTVPLMASAGDAVELIVSRPAYINGNSSHRNYEPSSFHPWIDDNDREDCSSPQGSRPGSQILTKTL
ncbi:glutamate receptor interacting protein isoform X1 [Dermacentor variabilis]|uniref:glutamate receptor interacting protein isoform X1 n=1 Tax=Dermacentor variabilis TaxID=34621 RepID=UPI003F5B2C4F